MLQNAVYNLQILLTAQKNKKLFEGCRAIMARFILITMIFFMLLLYGANKVVV